jgi:hypothetical protein
MPLAKELVRATSDGAPQVQGINPIRYRIIQEFLEHTTNGFMRDVIHIHVHR